jgi:AcrR family transcriptional regulator
MTSVDGRRVRGDESRSAVMKLAVNIASVDGLEGLSIGSLADRAARSKSGVISLFGTKERLQLATIEASRAIFTDTVIRPALRKKGGLERLSTLLKRWIFYSESRVFAGGCFFVAATVELGSRPGPLRDAIASAIVDWNDCIRRVISRAIDMGELDPATDVEQCLFEIRALLDAANSDSLLFGTSEPYARARTALTRMFPVG